MAACSPFADPIPHPAARRSGRLRRCAALLFLSTLLLAGLAACSAPGPAAGSGQEPAAASAAGAAFARGAYAEAATAWQREALDAAPAKAASLRVRAADAWLLAGRARDAQDVLRWVSRDELSPADRARLDLVLADLALRGNRPDEAEALLAQAAAALPDASEQRYRGLVARARDQMASPGSRTLAQAAGVVARMDRYDPAAAVRLLQDLESVTSHELSLRAAGPQVDTRDDTRGDTGEAARDDTAAGRQLAGWFDLALVIRRNLVRPEGVSDAIAEWKTRHPEHLLDETQALDAWLQYRQLFAAPRRTAVLLPASGGFRTAGDALRDGLISAYLAQPGGGELLFFPTGDDNQSAISAYFNALDAGADRIVGPLRKESVEALLTLAGLATPVLALNELPQDFTPPPGLAGQLHGLSLSQEAEVAAVARHAAASGYQRAIVLAPESAWGERMAAVFEDEFLQGDRQVVAASRYPEEENDHSALLERALRLDESKQRGQQLENTLQIPLEFVPVRRGDVDVIFMAASATQAKQIRPQLRFLDAGDVPVYATGRIYSGEPDPALNQDLDGVRFPITPWALEHAKRKSIPDLDSLRSGAMASLFALGQDAWNLLPWLELMRKDPDFAFPGASGTYSIDRGRSGRVGIDRGGSDGGGLRREPAWAVFSGGLPVPLANPAEPGLAPR
ncbi:MAG: penicillin-binding protein activator [Lysobacterales bacterium]|nr:MAG: penicillin-binding protein activator [Xanthomonadales bacterium]